jgi:hypothetical protein
VVDEPRQEKIDVVKSRLIRNYGYFELHAEGLSSASSRTPWASSCPKWPSAVPKNVPQSEAIFANVKEIHDQAAADATTLRLSLDSKAPVAIGPFSRGGQSRAGTTGRLLQEHRHPPAQEGPGGLLAHRRRHVLLVRLEDRHQLGELPDTDIDEVVLGDTNEPEYRRLQNNEFMEALRDRTVKIDIPCRELLSVVKEEYEDMVKSEVQRAIAADEDALPRRRGATPPRAGRTTSPARSRAASAPPRALGVR